eukprot:Nk52_evm29s163 gene=Nk52_evmTU29s163
MEAFDHINDFLYDSLFASFAAHYNGDHQDKEDHYIRRRRGCLLQRYRAYKGRQSMGDIEKGMKESIEEMESSVEKLSATGVSDELLETVIPEEHLPAFRGVITFGAPQDVKLYSEYLIKVAKLRSEHLLDFSKNNPRRIYEMSAKIIVSATAMTDERFKQFLGEQKDGDAIVRIYEAQVGAELQKIRENAETQLTENRVEPGRDGTSNGISEFYKSAMELPITSHEEVLRVIHQSEKYDRGGDGGWRLDMSPWDDDPPLNTPAPGGGGFEPESSAPRSSGFGDPAGDIAHGNEVAPEGGPL